jgi:excisionase family DNA binding protein
MSAVETKAVPDDRLLLRGVEVAARMGCSRALAYKLMKEGILPTVRIPGGRMVRVPSDGLVEWIKRNTRPAMETDEQHRTREALPAEAERLRNIPFQIEFGPPQPSPIQGAGGG